METIQSHFEGLVEYYFMKDDYFGYNYYSIDVFQFWRLALYDEYFLKFLEQIIYETGEFVNAFNHIYCMFSLDKYEKLYKKLIYELINTKKIPSLKFYEFAKFVEMTVYFKINYDSYALEYENVPEEMRNSELLKMPTDYRIEDGYFLNVKLKDYLPYISENRFVGCSVEEEMDIHHKKHIIKPQDVFYQKLNGKDIVKI